MFELTPADPPESNMEPRISITVITNVPWEKYHLHIIYTIHKQTNHEFFLFPWWAEVKGDRSPAAIERWANITERRGRSHVFFCTKPRQTGWYMKECEMVNMWKWRLLDLCSSFFWMLRHCWCMLKLTAESKLFFGIQIPEGLSQDHEGWGWSPEQQNLGSLQVLCSINMHQSSAICLEDP